MHDPHGMCHERKRALTLGRRRAFLNEELLKSGTIAEKQKARISASL